MRVLILHDAIATGARPDESDVLQQAAHVESALQELGHTCSRLPLTLDLAAARAEIEGWNPDIVFNLVESIDRQGRLIHVAPALLDVLEIPYSGAPTAAMFCTSGKLVAKKLLAGSGLPTPLWRTLQDLQSGCPVPADKWILKSVWEHASVGLDEDSVIEADAPETLAEALGPRLSSLGGEGFAEQFIPGREFNLSLIASPNGPQVLPPAEILFEGYAPEKPHVVGYRAKWDDSSYEYSHTPRRFDFPKSDLPMLSNLRALSLECWRVFSVRGYARVDFRVDNSGQPWILEINVNPCLSPDAGFAAALDRAAISPVQAVDWVLQDALRSCGERATSGSALRFDERKR